jgi:NADH-quinone oxidoreductase subunit L
MESMFTPYAWIIPILPLLAFVVLLVLGKTNKTFGISFSIAAIFASFVLSLLVFWERLADNASNYVWDGWNWLEIGSFQISLGFEINNLNALMLVIVTVVSLLVHIYSVGYMHDDERKTTFFSYIALFTFSMLGLVIAENIVQLFIFWELVGVCSFLLVGFWYFKPEAKAAAKKAFIVTRVGDLGFFIAILLLFTYLPEPSLSFTYISQVFTSDLVNQIPDHIQFWIALLIFVGAIGKSGQFPLHTWLPDAMEGPTPISALIHAATMVAAGVYLVARTYDVFLAAPGALEVVAIIGAFTAIFAAIIGITQNDIKRVLAYSTVSQLGYMMMALGFGTKLALAAAMFHLLTHAFFKALLFLGAGSVIHSLHEQDIQKMGGAGRYMKVTTITFAIGALALSGIFPLAGFWSKDAILVEALHYQVIFFVVGSLAALFTAFYMTRLFCLVFLGEHKGQHKPHESPFSMTLPLVVLAVLAVVAGFVYTPFIPWLATWLTGEEVGDHLSWTVIFVSSGAALAGILLGWLFYGKKAISAEKVAASIPWLYQLSFRKFYIDELYQVAVVKPLKVVSYLLDRFDEYVVDGAVRFTAGATVWLGGVASRLQNGQIQIYVLVTIFGFIIFVLALIGRRFW